MRPRRLRKGLGLDQLSVGSSSSSKGGEPSGAGANAVSLEAGRYVLQETPTRTIVDPFCGWGTVLAVANALGLDAVGVDIAPRMCGRARKLRYRIESRSALSDWNSEQ